MSPQTLTRATIEDLYAYDGKAELIGGRIVPLMGTGNRCSRIAGWIYQAIDQYAVAVDRGMGMADNSTYIVPELLSGRESFIPDASYYVGEPPEGELEFTFGAPIFAVEVRSKNDYGAFAERAMAEKRADYFEAGTLVVWDVDLLARTVSVYRSDAPDVATTFHVGEQADAEPAMPGWRLELAPLFARLR